MKIKSIYKIRTLLAAIVMAFTSASAFFAQGLVYDKNSRNPLPVPPAEREVYAKPWLKISNKSLQLEGVSL